LDLSVDVNKDGKKTLGAMLQGFVKEDKLEGQNKYHCEKWVNCLESCWLLSCKSKAVATKSFKIFEAPPILTIHFKRFEMSFGYGGRARAEKFNGYIEYPEWLDIAPFMVNKVSCDLIPRSHADDA
jgi:ubiquitin carboxyl-terminal hydrolase 36/42